jgi:hypothetical protein
MPLLDSDSAIEPRPFGCSVPLTAAQRRAWDGMNKAVGRPVRVWMCAAAARISGNLNCDFLRESIATVVRRHESLRTRFVLVDGSPVQQIDPEPGRYDLRIIDLSKLSVSDAELEVKRLAQEFIEQKENISTELAFEARLWKLSEHEHVLILLLDHMVADWTSNGILNREIWTLYEQAGQGIPFSLPALPLQFADYAVWQQRTYDSWMKKHETYWKEHLSGLPPQEIPNDIESKGNDANLSHGTTMHIPFGKDLSDRIRDAARRDGTTLPVLGLTAFAVALSHWCRERDLLIPLGRRLRPELQPMIGYLSGLIHLRIDLSERETLGDLLARVKHEFSQAFYHQDFERVPDFIPGFLTTFSPDSRHEKLFQWRSARRVAAYPQNQQRFTQLRIQPFLVRAPELNLKSLKFNTIFQNTKAGIFLTLYYSPNFLTSDTVQWFGSNVSLVAEALARGQLDSLHSAIIGRR